jgi:lycopene beta-cyclase
VPEKFDYIFAGFGLSGMSLIYELSKKDDFESKHILVIDSDLKNRNDRTWSFWTNQKNDFVHLARKSWKKGVFFAPNQTRIPINLKDYTYYTIEGIDLYNFIWDYLKQYNNVLRIHENIIKVEENGEVITTENKYHGNLVFCSYFTKSDFKPGLSKYFLWQHFYGFVIKTESDCFDSEEFTLMDFRKTDKRRCNFFYILPYSNNEALVEFTEFSVKLYSEHEYRAMLERYIKNELNISKYSITKIEYNAIPMTDFQLNMFVSKNVINIGSLVGYIKPSSGYAFTRTLERNKMLAEMLKSAGKIDPDKLSSKQLYKAFDNSVLYLIQHEKLHGGLLFASLFKSLGGDRVFKFLDEKATPNELLQVLWASPKKMEFIKYFALHWGR